MQGRNQLIFLGGGKLNISLKISVGSWPVAPPLVARLTVSLRTVMNSIFLIQRNYSDVWQELLTNLLFKKNVHHVKGSGT